jgi:retinol dehydrogenase-12
MVLINMQQLLVRNAKVYLAARDAQKVKEAIAELKNETGKEAIFLQLDLSDILAVRRSAQEFLSYACSYPLFFVMVKTCVFRKEDQLHVLINNA